MSRPRKKYNWIKEILKGNTDKFYNSAEWKELRRKRLEKDNNECQFFAGKWTDGIHFPEKIKPVKATIVHHIIPIKERPDLALDIDNTISLSFEAHEIIEDRNRFKFKRKEKYINEEKW